MTKMDKKSIKRVQEDNTLFSGLFRFNIKVLALTTGIWCGAAVFIATNWLVLKGGDRVGPHLSLLGQYFIGYSVTFQGSFIGFAYGLLAGALSGALTALIYNKLVSFKERARS
jgi:hypothetical protein